MTRNLPTDNTFLFIGRLEVKGMLGWSSRLKVEAVDNMRFIPMSQEFCKMLYGQRSLPQEMVALSKLRIGGYCWDLAG